MKPDSQKFIRYTFLLIILVAHWDMGLGQDRPNILFAISDDQTAFHTSFEGCTWINTPAFDRVAREGIYFENCYSGSPGCAPSRSTIVTGRYHWQNEQAGQHASGWLEKYVPFVDLVADNGYHTGYTGKGVGPFKYGDSPFRKMDAAGKEYNDIRYTDTEHKDFAGGINPKNYFANFKKFMEERDDDEPFFFWYGGHEPHRTFEQGSWKRHGKSLDDVEVPAFLPDNDIVRGDLLDYGVEIEWFDRHLGMMLDYLEEIGELENTIVIVTADNGMSFPRAKANGYEYGIHVPLAVRMPQQNVRGRRVSDLVTFVDFAPTFLELTETSDQGMLPLTGKSMVSLLRSDQSGLLLDKNRFVLTGRERHSSSRHDNLGYPQRTIQQGFLLLVWNMKPDRWPSGAPQRLVSEGSEDTHPMYGIDEEGTHHSDWAFTDIDACPTKSFIVEHYNDWKWRKYFDWSMAKRPEFELYDVYYDKDCLHNLIDQPGWKERGEELKSLLAEELERTGDPRVTGPDKEVFDSYLRYSPMRYFPVD
ncbi:MAG TPA: sulfatase [Membranihabitans sp.]|nr:sulfatase [Membranihabitans sp.]